MHFYFNVGLPKEGIFLTTIASMVYISVIITHITNYISPYDIDILWGAFHVLHQHLSLWLVGRDSGNNFRVPEIGSDNSYLHFQPVIGLFLVVSSHFWADTTLNKLCFWLFLLDMTKIEVISFRISKKQQKLFPLS